MKSSNETRLAGLCVAVAIGVAGCCSDKASTRSSGYSADSSVRGRAGAIARLNPTEGNKARGEVFFSKEDEGIRV
ncbi:MAG: hypothetical protein ABI651_08705, partial [Verrucomicrobiota bacterium]